MNQETTPPANQPAPRPLIQHESRGGMLRRLRTYFLTGIVITGPIGITIWLTVQIIDSIDSLVTRLIPARYLPETYLPFGTPGIGIVVAVVVLTLIGFVTANFLGRTLLGLGERLVNRMPIVRTIYGTLKQIFATVLAQSSKSFREVVLIEYPRHGVWAIGFVTSTAHREIRDAARPDMVNVFLPTTPNPTSGFLLILPRSEIVPLKMSVEDGIKMVISGGLVTPGETEGPSPVAPPIAGQPDRK